MADVTDRVEQLVDAGGFSGVVRVERGSVVTTAARGLADRRHGIANEIDTRFAIASGVKGMTALTLMSLVERRELALDTTARSLLGGDLPLIDARVTVEHLLAHRSGIGDYLDEDALDDIADYVLPVPVHRLDRTERYLEVLDGHAQVSEPGERFAYNNGGYVVLALLAERATGRSFADLVEHCVIRPANLSGTDFLRSDELPGDAAIGYLGDGPRSNVLHLPVVGNGDGGIYSTADDVMSLWRALDAGRIVTADTLRWMWTPQGHESDGTAYGRGFWLDAGGSRPALEGYDAGVSFRTAHDPATERTYVVMSNTSEGAWPVAKALDELVFGD